MLRAVVLVLLLANALLLAARHGWLGGAGTDADREPQRVARQIHPELVTVLPESAASGAQATATPRCLEAGPFGPNDAPTAERALRDTGLTAGLWEAVATDDRGRFMIYMGKYSDREAVLRKLEEIKRRQVPAEVLPEGREHGPGLNLGQYGDRASADAALAALNQRGVRTARVLTLRPAQRVVRLRVPAADGALRDKLTALKLPAGLNFQACADAPAASAASAATAPAKPASALAPSAAPPAAASTPASSASRAASTAGA